MLCLSCTLSQPLTITASHNPLFSPHSLILDPFGETWLFEIQVWLEGIEMSRCKTLVFVAMLMIPVQNFDSLGQHCIFLLGEDWWCISWFLQLLSLLWFWRTGRTCQMVS